MEVLPIHLKVKTKAFRPNFLHLTESIILSLVDDSYAIEVGVFSTIASNVLSARPSVPIPTLLPE